MSEQDKFFDELIAEIKNLEKRKEQLFTNSEIIANAIKEEMERIENTYVNYSYEDQKSIWDYCDDCLNDINKYTNKLCSDFEEDISYYKRKMSSNNG